MSYSRPDTACYPYILYPPKIEAIRSNPPVIPAPSLISVPNPPAIPPEPRRPESLTPPRRIPIFSMAGAAMFAVIISSIVGGRNFPFLLLLLLLAVAISGSLYALDYPNRLSSYRNQVEKERIAHSVWQEEKNRKERVYQEEIKRIQRENKRIQREHERTTRELSTSRNSEKLRQQMTALALGQLQPTELGTEVDITGFDPRGYAEHSDNCSFPTWLNQYFGDKIFVLHHLSGSNRIPDFAYVDRAKNIFIDIEIDEPYTPRQYPISNGTLKETHCIGQSHYDERDRQWIHSDWFVIHFSERQAITQGQSCCKAIARLISELTGDKAILQRFANVQDLTTEPRWTIEEAREMANRRERLHYR